MRHPFLCTIFVIVAVLSPKDGMAAATITDKDSGSAYVTGNTFSTNTIATVDVTGTIAAFNVANGVTLELICTTPLTITTLTLGKGAVVKFTGSQAAILTSTVLDSTGVATIGIGKGGLTFTNQPTNIGTATILEFIAAGTVLTCNNGTSLGCELRMTKDGALASTSITTLAGLISGVGVLTLPNTCNSITSGGSGRGSANNSLVFAGPMSFTDGNIFSSGTMLLLHNLTYAGAGSPPIPRSGTGQVAANQPPCSAFVLGALGVVVDGGAGLTMKALQDTATFSPTFAGALTISNYNPTSTNMVVNSGPLTVKRMQMTGAFQIHNGAAAVINMGG